MPVLLFFWYDSEKDLDSINMEAMQDDGKRRILLNLSRKVMAVAIFTVPYVNSVGVWPGLLTQGVTLDNLCAYSILTWFILFAGYYIINSC